MPLLINLYHLHYTFISKVAVANPHENNAQLVKAQPRQDRHPPPERVCRVRDLIFGSGVRVWG